MIQRRFKPWLTCLSLSIVWTIATMNYIATSLYCIEQRICHQAFSSGVRVAFSILGFECSFAAQGLGRVQCLVAEVILLVDLHSN